MQQHRSRIDPDLTTPRPPHPRAPEDATQPAAAPPPGAKDPALRAWPGASGQWAPRAHGHVIAGEPGTSAFRLAVPPNVAKGRWHPPPRGSSRESSPHCQPFPPPDAACGWVLPWLCHPVQEVWPGRGRGREGRGRLHASQVSSCRLHPTPGPSDPRPALPGIEEATGLTGIGGSLGFRDFPALKHLCHRSAFCPLRNWRHGRVFQEEMRG